MEILKTNKNEKTILDGFTYTDIQNLKRINFIFVGNVRNTVLSVPQF